MAKETPAPVKEPVESTAGQRESIAAAASATGDQSRVRQLQRSAGNRAAARLLAYGQAKMEVGAADDRYEREADAAAERVVAALQRSEAGGSDGGVEQPVQRAVVPRISRVQRKAVGREGGEVSAEIEAEIVAARAGGSPLPDETRAQMEGAFGSSFGDVRVHTGGQADQLNDAVSAKAFTVGSDIFFRGGMPDTSGRAGQELVAHELTHVVQQRQGQVSGPVQRIQRKGGLFDQLYDFVFGPSEEQKKQAAAKKAKEDEENRKRQVAEQERLKKEEDDRKRAAEAERLKREEEERLKKEEEARKKAEAERIAREDAKLQTTAQIKAKSGTDLLKYVQQKPNWHTRSTITVAEKAEINTFLNFLAEPGVESALGDATLQELLDAAAGPLGGDLNAVLADLRVYVAAVTNNDPIELDRASDVDRARELGDGLKKMIAQFKKFVLKTALKQDELAFLIDNGFVDDVIAYHQIVPQPFFQAETGADFASYCDARDEGWNPADYAVAPLLGQIRNFHRFNQDVLDTIQDNYNNGNTANKPLTLIFQAAIDHNGAFHREDPLTTLVRDPNGFAILYEGGTSLAAYTAQVSLLATQFGVDGKVDQVMFSGHGNAQNMDMAGDIAESSEGEVEEVGDGIEVGDAESEALFDEVLAYMTTKTLHDARALTDPSAKSYRRILFNACLTNSNIVDTTLDQNNAKARKQISDYIKANASLATHLANKAKAQGSDAKSLGANASIGEIEFVDSTGALDLVSNEDRYVTSDKIVYAEKGIEPLGVIRAALEAWAEDPASTRQAMRKRVAAATTKWSDTLICIVYKKFLAKSKSGDKGMGSWLNEFTVVMSAVDELAHGGSENAVKKVSGYIRRGWRDEVDLLFDGGATSDEWKSTPELRLVGKQLVAGIYTGDAKLQKDVLDELENFTAKTAMIGKDQYVDVAWLVERGLLAKMLTGTPSKGKTILAMVAVIDGGAPAEAKAYFSSMLVPEAPEVPGLPEVPEVPEVPDQPAPRPLVAAVPPEPGRAKVPAIGTRRAEVPEVKPLDGLPELPAVQAERAVGPVGRDGTAPTVIAPGRPGRPRRDAIDPVPKVPTHLPDSVDFTNLVGGRRSETEFVALLK